MVYNNKQCQRRSSKNILSRGNSREDFMSIPLKPDFEQVKRDFEPIRKKISSNSIAHRFLDFKKCYSVYMFGGYDATGRLADSELRKARFSSGSMKIVFSRVTINGSYKPQSRFGHTLNFYCPAQLLILFGGQTHEQQFLSDMHLFNLNTHIWNEVQINHPFITIPRAHHCLEVVDKQVFIHGGVNHDGYIPGCVYQFSLEDQFNPLPPAFLH